MPHPALEAIVALQNRNCTQVIMAQLLKLVAKPITEFLDWGSGLDKLQSFARTELPVFSAVLRHEIAVEADILWGCIRSHIALKIGMKLESDTNESQLCSGQHGVVAAWILCVALAIVIAICLKIMWDVTTYRKQATSASKSSPASTDSVPKGNDASSNTSHDTMDQESISTSSQRSANIVDDIVNGSSGLSLATEDLVEALTQMGANLKAAERLHVWDEAVDTDTGAPYYYNIQNGDTQWSLPSLRLRHRWIRRFSYPNSTGEADSAASYCFENDMLPGVKLTSLDHLAAVFTSEDAERFKSIGRPKLDSQPKIEASTGKNVPSRATASEVSRSQESGGTPTSTRHGVQQSGRDADKKSSDSIAERNKSSFWISRMLVVQVSSCLMLLLGLMCCTWTRSDVLHV